MTGTQILNDLSVTVLQTPVSAIDFTGRMVNKFIEGYVIAPPINASASLYFIMSRPVAGILIKCAVLNISERTIISINGQHHKVLPAELSSPGGISFSGGGIVGINADGDITGNIATGGGNYVLRVSGTILNFTITHSNGIPDGFGAVYDPYVYLNSLPCLAGNTAPLPLSNLLATCASVADLTSLQPGQAPVGTSFQWHSGVPATISNIVLNPQTAGAGTYYLSLNDNLTHCSSPVSLPVLVNIVPVPLLVVTSPALACVADLTAASVTSGSSPGLGFTYYSDQQATQVLGQPQSVKTNGTYYIRGSTANGCLTPVVAVKVLIDKVENPLLGVIVQPALTDPGNFSIMNFNPLYGYTINPSAGVSRSGALFTAPPGTYTVTATGSCGSAISNSVILNTIATGPVVPAVPIVITPVVTVPIVTVPIVITPIVTVPIVITPIVTVPIVIIPIVPVIPGSPMTVVPTPVLQISYQPACSSITGSFTLQNFDSRYTYTITPSAGVVRNGPVFTAPAGIYTLIASMPGSINSLSSDQVILHSQPLSPVLMVKDPGIATVSSDLTKPSVTEGSDPALTFTYFWDAEASQSMANPKAVQTSGTYYIQGTNANGCTSAVKPVHVQISRILAGKGQALFIPNVFTPNGDGLNDWFEITGLNQYAGSVLSIYNRWGNRVYQSENYDRLNANNGWKGAGLDPGTYYYILKLPATANPALYKGWVQLIR